MTQAYFLLPIQHLSLCMTERCSKAFHNLHPCPPSRTSRTLTLPCKAHHHPAPPISQMVSPSPHPTSLSVQSSSVLPTRRVGSYSKVPTPMSLSSLSSNAKPSPPCSPPAHLIILTPFSPLYPHKASITPRNTHSDYFCPWSCVFSHSFSISNTLDFLIHHPQSPDLH